MMKTFRQKAHMLCLTCLILFILSGTVVFAVESLPVGTNPGPVSEQYSPPPGLMPVVILQGSPYEMGYQYGLQVPEYLAIVRDSVWAGALSEKSYDEILDECRVDKEYIARELNDFQFIEFFKGISDAMNDQGYAFTPVDPIVMLYYGGHNGPAPEEHCTAFAAYGNATNNTLIVGDNFDYYSVSSNSYQVLLFLYPDNGYSCIIPSGAGRTGNNVVVNEKGLVYITTAGPAQGAGDTGPGISAFLELPSVGMSAASVPEGEEILLNITRSFSLSRLLADTSGNAEVIESTREKFAIRNGSEDFIIAANHYLNPAMKESQKIWDPLRYYPSSYYRYITAEKQIRDGYGKLDYENFRHILSSSDWWDGQAWHRDDRWSSNTINRFRPTGATLYSLITVPGDRVVSICQGNPDMPGWGTRAPGQTGTYVSFTLGSSPEYMVYKLRSDADAHMWETIQLRGDAPDTWTNEQWNSIENDYWEGNWWHNKGTLETDPRNRTFAFGKAATAYSSAIAHTRLVHKYCESETTS
ncbi:hypothetical protein F1737_08725 [Methanoplanus sp. FWC-SCC4]|uniref:Peptidase C45 hydrolase domain-containing protein n=1 Tax=Methanochimaera problematica TaxID=2609417 RepID=A0AA97I4R2_9EURY|nr:C45 family peptidase [Methanoplanus sp. FWC-SCC4]WOF16769.1 hypothetical protein F1737_08725 [Methanoplanus sp. FWC-SCC4]